MFSFEFYFSVSPNSYDALCNILSTLSMDGTHVNTTNSIEIYIGPLEQILQKDSD